MFIEVTSLSEGAVIVNTSNVAYIKPFYSELRTKEIYGTHIHFANPTAQRGCWSLLVKEPYDKVKQMIMEGK